MKRFFLERGDHPLTFFRSITSPTAAPSTTDSQGGQAVVVNMASGNTPKREFRPDRRLPNLNPYVPLSPAQPGKVEKSDYVRASDWVSADVVAKPDYVGIVPGMTTKPCPEEGCGKARKRTYRRNGPMHISLCKDEMEIKPRVLIPPFLLKSPLIRYFFETPTGDFGWYTLITYAECPDHGRVRVEEKSGRRQFSRWRRFTFWVRECFIDAYEDLKS